MEVKLKRNGWHKRIQVWTFGRKAPEFNSLCPFFWTTVFCVLVSPFVASFRYLVMFPLKLAVGVFDIAMLKVADLIAKLDKYFVVEVCQPLYEQKITNYVEQMTDDDAMDIYAALYKVKDYDGKVKIVDGGYLRDKWYEDRDNKTYKLYLDKLQRWKDKVGDDWQTRLQALAVAREKQRKEQEKLQRQWEKEQEAKKERLKKTFNLIAYYTKYLLYLAMGVAGVYVLYFLSLFGLFLYEVRADIYEGLASFGNFVVKAVVVGGPYVLIGAVALALLVPLFILIGKLVVKCNLFQVKANTKPSKLFLLVEKFIDGVVSVAGFFVMYFKAAKQNYCPHIDWEE